MVWSLIRAMGPCIRDGSVQVWAIDPKGGMELTPGAGLFTRFAYQDPASMVQLLEDAVGFMRARTERLRLAGHRLLTPTAEDPLVVVVVDEMAALTAYAGDRDLKRRAEAALQLLLSQGRAPGVLVVAAVQDPGKDVVTFRDLFPFRIALRLLEDVQVDMVLGRSARHHGAECDLIPPSLPGVGYVIEEGVREPVRVRASHVTDRDLAQMVHDYTPTPASVDAVSRRCAWWGSPDPWPLSPTVAGSAGPSWEVLGRAGVESAEKRAGGCSRPVRLVGSTLVVNKTTGEVLRSYSSDEELDGTTYVKCGNRRAQACPTCSAEYKGDAWHLLLCGLAGGKGIPDIVCAIIRARSRRSPPPPSVRCTGSGRRDPAGRAGTSRSVHTAARCGAPSGTTTRTAPSGRRCARTATTTPPTWCGSGTPRSCGAGSPSPCNATWPGSAACR